MDYEKALEMALETPAGAEQEVKEERFVVDSIEKLEWAAKQIARKKAEQAKINALVDERIKKLEAWREEQLKPLTNDISYLEYLTRAFAEDIISKQKKKKSFVLPNGAKFSITSGKTDIKKKSDDALLAYLQKNNYKDYIKETQSAKWSDFKKACHIEGDKVISPDGEVVDCIEIVPGEDKYTVNTDAIELESK